MDWVRIVNDIRQSGLTQVQIAQAAGCLQSTVSALSRGEHGGRVSFGVGAKLIDLWRERCAGGDSNAQPPQVTQAA